MPPIPMGGNIGGGGGGGGFVEHIGMHMGIMEFPQGLFMKGLMQGFGLHAIGLQKLNGLHGLHGLHGLQGLQGLKPFEF